MPGEDSEDEEYLLTVDLYDPVWSEELVPDSHKYLCIHEIPRLATPTQWPNQGVPATPPLLPDQIEMLPDHDLMDLDIPGDIPDLLDVPEGVISDFDAWA